MKISAVSPKRKKHLAASQGPNPGLLHCRRILYPVLQACKPSTTATQNRIDFLRFLEKPRFTIFLRLNPGKDSD